MDQFQQLFQSNFQQTPPFTYDEFQKYFYPYPQQPSPITFEEFQQIFYPEVSTIQTVTAKYPILNKLRQYFRPTDSPSEIGMTEKKKWRPFHDLKEKIKSFWQRHKNKHKQPPQGIFVSNFFFFWQCVIKSKPKPHWDHRF